MDEEPRGIERILTAGPPQAQVSVRVLLPILFISLLVEVTCLAWLTIAAASFFDQLEMKELPPPTLAWLRASEFHRSALGMLSGLVVAVGVAWTARKGAWDSTGRWLCAGLLACLVAAPLVAVASTLAPLIRIRTQLSK